MSASSKDPSPIPTASLQQQKPQEVVDDDIVIANHVSQQCEWLGQELAYDGSSSSDGGADKNGARVLHHLDVTETGVGLYGRTVVHLSRRRNNNDGGHKMTRMLPAHRLTPGDPVQIQSSASTSHGKPIRTEGVVTAVTEDALVISLSASHRQTSKTQNPKDATNNNDDQDESDLGPAPLTVQMASNVHVHETMVQALQTLIKPEMLSNPLVQALFFPAAVSHQAQATTSATQSPQSPMWFNPNLDASQQKAIQFSLPPSSNETQDRPPVACIHGPPGTGKTTVVVELIRQALLSDQKSKHDNSGARRRRILVTAPSNVAVDNILRRLVAVDPKLRMVRLGHAARLDPTILPYSLEALVQAAEGTDIVRAVRAELQGFLNLLHDNSGKKKKKKRVSAADRRTAYREIKALRAEIKRRERTVVHALLTSAQVVLCTCVGAAQLGRLWKRQQQQQKDVTVQSWSFDLVVIDEAAQALEAACWVPIVQALSLSSSTNNHHATPKLVLAGDPCQLPPTVRHPGVAPMLGMTLMERVLALYEASPSHTTDSANVSPPHAISRLLAVQYRMNHAIADWASQAMYQGRLTTHESVYHHCLARDNREESANNAETSQDNDDDFDSLTRTVLLLIDTAGCAMYEEVNENGSRFNRGEADCVVQHVQALLATGLAASEICVISPYAGQVQILKQALLLQQQEAAATSNSTEGIEVRTVDGFQGGERAAVVLSLVRSQAPGMQKGKSSSVSSKVGFLQDNRRLNVAVTRAQKHLCIVCDSDTVSHSLFLQGLMEWMQEHGRVESALAMEQEANLQGDLEMAQLELERYNNNNNEAPPKDRQQSNRQNASNVPSSQQQQLPPAQALKAKKNQAVGNKNNNVSQGAPQDEDRIRRVLDAIRHFAAHGVPGNDLALSSELSSADRRCVHELAEELGLDHVSDGVQGVDRRIVLSLPKLPEDSSAAAKDPPTSPDDAEDIEEGNDDDDDDDDDDDVSRTRKAASAFAALQVHDDDDEDQKVPQQPKKPKSTHPSAMNSVLGDLAKERAARHAAAKPSVPVKEAATTSASKKKKAKKKPKATPAAAKAAAPPLDDDLDEMAFLDAQIDKVQNSHGRQVTGKGKNYRSIVNGILLATPPGGTTAAERNKTSKLTGALQSKLSQAQQDRKPKPKKKK